MSIVYQPTDPESSYLADPTAFRRAALSYVFLLLFAGLLGFVVYKFVDICVILDACPAED